MANLLGSIVAIIVNALLGRFFPAHPKVTAEAVAQAQKDRGDTLQSQKDAHREAETVRRDLDSRPVDELRQHDANEYDPKRDA